VDEGLLLRFIMNSIALMDALWPNARRLRSSAIGIARLWRRNGILGAEQAAKMTDVPNVQQQGTRLGNWLARESCLSSRQAVDQTGKCI
jgi:hypothetical protein